jgi:tetratricopeptide (TPR) repeat protein
MIREGLKKLQERKFCEALSILDKLIKLNPKDGDVLFTLGNIYYELNDLKKSSFYFEKSLNIFSNSQIIINNYAITLQSLGEIEKAKKLFEHLIKLDPNNIKAYYRLFRIDHKNFEDNYLDKIKLFKIKNNLSLENSSLINFIISKYQKNKDKKNEITYLHNAHKNQFDSNTVHNSKLNEYHIKILINNFNKFDFLNNYKKFHQLRNKKPIFIIGLPRSGSTLIETLLVQNEKKCYSYGESSAFETSIYSQIKKNILIKNYNYQNFKFSIDEEIFLNFIKNTYLYSDNDLIIDKSLENFFYIDLILKVFPEAKFIHTFRNRLDSAIAIYQSMLIYLPWTHSIDNIIKYIFNYEKIMNYFKKKYPDKILDVNLENFTNDPNVHSKIIYDFCNLHFTDDILKFYNKKDLVSKTTSFMQVRNKIQKYDKNKYEPYYFLIKNKFA